LNCIRPGKTIISRAPIGKNGRRAFFKNFRKGGRRGWPVILSGLKSLLETGKPVPEFDWWA